MFKVLSDILLLWTNLYLGWLMFALLVYTTVWSFIGMLYPRQCWVFTTFWIGPLYAGSRMTSKVTFVKLIDAKGSKNFPQNADVSNVCGVASLSSETRTNCCDLYTNSNCMLSYIWRETPTAGPGNCGLLLQPHPGVRTFIRFIIRI